MSKGKCVYGRSQGAVTARRKKKDVGVEEVKELQHRGGKRREEEENVGREEVEEELKGQGGKRRKMWGDGRKPYGLRLPKRQQRRETEHCKLGHVFVTPYSNNSNSWRTV